MPTQGVHFHCNVNALTPTERARHKELTETLMAKSGKVVETDQAYEFHYRHPEWVSAVSAVRFSIFTLICRNRVRSSSCA